MMLTGAVGSTLDNPPEPILGRIQRFKEVATALIGAKTTDDLPSEVANECVVKLSSYWFNMPPAARLSGFANAWTNSGSAHIASPWTQRQIGREL